MYTYWVIHGIMLSNSFRKRCFEFVTSRGVSKTGFSHRTVPSSSTLHPQLRNYEFIDDCPLIYISKNSTMEPGQRLGFTRATLVINNYIIMAEYRIAAKGNGKLNKTCLR
jgi:hypothetical protein